MVTDEDILLRILLASTPVMGASGLADVFDVTRQNIDRRLRQLQERGLVDGAMVSGSRVWWVTDDGRRYVLDEFFGQ